MPASYAPLFWVLGSDWLSPSLQILEDNPPFDPIDISAFATAIRVDIFDAARTGQSGVYGWGPYPTGRYWGWPYGNAQTYPVPLASLTSAANGGVVVDDATTGTYHYDVAATLGQPLLTTSWVPGNRRRMLTARWFRTDDATRPNRHIFDQPIIGVP